MVCFASSGCSTLFSSFITAGTKLTASRPNAAASLGPANNSQLDDNSPNDHFHASILNRRTHLFTGPPSTVARHRQRSLSTTTALHLPTAPLSVTGNGTRPFPFTTEHVPTSRLLHSTSTIVVFPLSLLELFFSSLVFCHIAILAPFHGHGCKGRSPTSWVSCVKSPHPRARPLAVTLGSQGP